MLLLLSDGDGKNMMMLGCPTGRFGILGAPIGVKTVTLA